ncbi:hypothetical protein BDN67DRAFT_819910 [Paxillus ammoniavirescens]|nr:hypothetical protein BDN67DRAFT_819910 [Paxillus ammoniavirescens]
METQRHSAPIVLVASLNNVVSQAPPCKLRAPSPSHGLSLHPSDSATITLRYQLPLSDGRYLIPIGFLVLPSSKVFVHRRQLLTTEFWFRGKRTTIYRNSRSQRHSNAHYP